MSDDTEVPAEIGPDKNVIWKAKTPNGNSSPVVVDGRIFLTGHEGDARFVLCLDARTGEEVWRKTLTRSRTEIANPINGYTTPSIATDGKSVFAFIPEFGLAAYTVEGKDLWQRPLGPFGGVQGMAVSPVYLDGRVYLLIDTPEQAWLAAYDATTGKSQWKAERPIGLLGGYATPAVHKDRNGRMQLIVSGALELTAYDAESGKRVWWATGITNYPAAPPLVTSDAVYTVEPYGDGGSPPWAEQLTKFDKDKDGIIQLTEVSGTGPSVAIWQRILRSTDKNMGNNDGEVTEQEFTRAFASEKPGGGLVRTKLDGKGDVSATATLWRHTKGVPYVTAPLLYKDTLYLVRNGGIVSVFDPKSGKLLRESRLKDAIGDYYASPVAAGNHIYFVSKEGKVSVVSATTEWEIVSSGNLDEQAIATPAIAGNRIFIRTENTLWCFGKPHA
ncbi:MAG: PQQ-binding-like beta-propeller repeat protein [Bryobacteraceae bacterium]|nr:PQQ-binding-like beta-propeller repeat protein [Bryobacteraceae bacterium]